MRMASVVKALLREQLRSFWDLLIVVALAPLFIWMYWSFVGGGSTSYAVLVLNEDTGIVEEGGARVDLATAAAARLSALTYESGAPLVSVRNVADRSEGEALLKNRKAAAMLVFAADFSRSVRAGRPLGPEQLTLVGDLTNPYYTPAAAFANAAVDSFVRQAAGQTSPITMGEHALGGSANRTEFEIYVPGLLIAAGTLMLFSIAIALSRLIESGAVRRLTLTRMTSFDLLGGISIIYVIVSLISVLLSFGLAAALGFRSEGSLWVGMLICAFTGVSVIGVGLVTACFCPNATRAAIVVNFPLLLLLFFSGAVFPIGNPRLFEIGGRAIGIFDILPQTHAAAALNKVLSLGMGIGDVSYELAALAALAALYFIGGVILFRARHLRAA
jgi:ABC-type multidrug transport system permease subunit